MIRATLSLRPERVTINPEDGSVPNVFEGTGEELLETDIVKKAFLGL